MKRQNNRVITLSAAIAAIVGSASLPVSAYDIISVPFKLTGEVVEFVGHTTGAAVDATGAIIDSSGKVVGKLVPGGGKEAATAEEVVVFNQESNAVTAASLYNRLADLEVIGAQQLASGAISKDKFEDIKDDLSSARKSLSKKLNTGGKLTFEEALEVATRVDQIAGECKTLFGTTTNAVVYTPMVIQTEPAHKRLLIYQRTVTDDGVKTTTTTTETTH